MTKVTTTLSNSKSQIEGFGEAYTRQLALIDRGFTEQLDTINSSMDDWVKNLDQNFETISHIISLQSDMFVEQIKQLQEAADSIASDAQNELKVNIEAATKSFEQASNVFVGQVEKVQEAADSIASNAQNEIRVNIEAATNAFERASLKLSEQINEQATFASENLTSIKDLVEILKENSEDLKTAQMTNDFVFEHWAAKYYIYD